MPNYIPDNYEPVEVRLKKFWADHPQGRVLTELVLHTEIGEYIVKAFVYDDREDERPSATGLAHEITGGRAVNQTSALENCETSAIGRALANRDYAPLGARPSREEMGKRDREARPNAPETAQKRPQPPKGTGDAEWDRFAEVLTTEGLREAAAMYLQINSAAGIGLWKQTIQAKRLGYDRVIEKARELHNEASAAMDDPLYGSLAPVGGKTFSEIMDEDRETER